MRRVTALMVAGMVGLIVAVGVLASSGTSAAASPLDRLREDGRLDCRTRMAEDDHGLNLDRTSIRCGYEGVWVGVRIDNWGEIQQYWLSPEVDQAEVRAILTDVLQWDPSKVRVEHGGGGALVLTVADPARVT